MARLSLPNLKDLGPKDIGRLVSSMKAAVEKFDLDDGWEPLASPKRHRLGITPKFVQIQVSDDKKGASYATVHADAVDVNEISFTSAKAYMRVLADV